jgi:hypothetical protein
MAPYCRAYNFTGEPDAVENTADWLAALETNIYQSNTNQEKVDFLPASFFMAPLQRNGLTSSQTKVIDSGILLNRNSS